MASDAPSGLPVPPRRLRYSCPSGYSAVTRLAACTARVVFPTPPIPPIAEMTIPGAALYGVRRSSSSSASWRDRPVKSVRGGGTRVWAGTPERGRAAS
jgi:hypothetical protein